MSALVLTRTRAGLKVSIDWNLEICKKLFWLRNQLAEICATNYSRRPTEPIASCKFHAQKVDLCSDLTFRPAEDTRSKRRRSFFKAGAKWKKKKSLSQFFLTLFFLNRLLLLLCRHRVSSSSSSARIFPETSFVLSGRPPPLGLDVCFTILGTITSNV